MAELSVPLLNRLVDRMFQHADPKADQNIWDLGRAAEEVFKEVQAERFFQTGDPAELGGYQHSPDQASRPVGPVALKLTDSQREFIARYGPTGRMRMSPVPLTFAGPPQPPPAPDYAAALGEVERRLMLKAPQYTGTTADKVDQLAQDFQAADQQIRQLNTGIEQLKREIAEKEQVIHTLLDEVRAKLDPEGEHEGESLTGLAQITAAQLQMSKKAYRELQERVGTEIETNSAEMLRRVLGAAENETLGHAAKRVAESAKSGWERFNELNNRQQSEFHLLNDKVRELVGAVDEFENDDHYMPGQPTLDAVRRVVRRLHELSRHPDGSSKSLAEVISEVQENWEGQEIEPLPGESMP